jgi:hypothetical protein
VEGGLSWLELDDRILEHPKFIRAVKIAGSDAIHLWLGFRAYCGQNLTNGRVPADMLDEVRGPKDPKRRKASLDALLAVGLLDPLAGGDVQMHNFLKWSSSRDAVLERREKARARKQRSREPGAGSHGVTDAEPREDSKRPDAGSHGGVNAQSQTPAGASPLPLPSTPLPSSAAETADNTNRIPCPPDLRLNSGQVANLKMNLGLDDSQIAALSVKFVNKFVGNVSDLRTHEVWLKCLSSSVCGDANNPKTRPPKSESGAIVWEG